MVSFVCLICSVRLLEQLTHNCLDTALFCSEQPLRVVKKSLDPVFGPFSRLIIVAVKHDTGIQDKHFYRFRRIWYVEYPLLVALFDQIGNDRYDPGSEVFRKTCRTEKG